jgi:hypothetical protein
MPGLRTVPAGLLAVGLLALNTAASTAEPSRPARTTAQVAADIDRLIDKQLAEKKVPASEQADDAEFLRRVTIDLIGRVPTADEARSFLARRESDKRTKLIDDLLARPEYGRLFGTLWHNRIIPLTPEHTRELKPKLFVWLAEGFNRNRPWSQTVSELLLAEGDVKESAPLAFYLSSANSVEGYVQADRVAGSVAQLFLGVNLRCAQCHKHPFARWKQADFWGVAAFFGRVGYTKETKEKRIVESAKIIGKDGQAQLTARPDASTEIPGKSKVVRARFLAGTEPALDPSAPFRPAFVKHLTSPDNEQFARAGANRLWAHFLGRGLVNPVDDIHPDNPATHPEVLTLLARAFAASRYDQKYLIRCICCTRAYQRSSRPLAKNRLDTELYSHQPLRLLAPEVMYDSLALVMDGVKIDKDLVKSVSNPGRGFWIASFSSQEAGEDATRYTHGVPQVLKLLNSMIMHAHSPNVHMLHKEKVVWDKAVDHLYLAALSRFPRNDERILWQKYRDKVNNLDMTYRDMLWTLLNSSEFIFNH